MEAIDTLLDGSAQVAAQLGGVLLLPAMAGRNGNFSVTTVALPLPPSTNSLFPGFRRRHKSAEYKAWEQEAALWLLEQPHLLTYGGLPQAPPKARWKLHLYVVLPNWRSDMDNRYKATIDFLAPRFNLQDRYLIQHTAVRCTGTQTGIVAVLEW